MAGTIRPETTREELRRLYAQDPERSLFRNIGRSLTDPIKPQDERGRFRPHPLVVWLVGIGLVFAGVFAYFSYNQP